MSSVDPGAGLTRSGAATDDRPLNDREYQLVQRLFSDPFSLPVAFKTWLVSYLETSDLNLPQSSIQGLRSTLADLITPPAAGDTGAILLFGGTVAPSGTKFCDGASYDRAVEADLFAVIGTLHGFTDSTHFNVPDMRGLVPVDLAVNFIIIA